MGFTKLDQIIGQTDLLDTREAIDHWKAQGLDFTACTKIETDRPVHNCEDQKHPIDDILDRIHRRSHGAEKKLRLKSTPITNIDRWRAQCRRRAPVACRASRRHNIGKADGHGQSFGAFLARGISFELEGEANDYAGKGLSVDGWQFCPPPIALFRKKHYCQYGSYGAIDGERLRGGR